MSDFSNANMCGANPELNNILSKLDAAKASAISKLDAPASTATAAFATTENELKGLKGKLQTIEIPTLPKLNLQAEIASLTSLTPGTPDFLSTFANIKGEFGDDLTTLGLDLEDLVSNAIDSVLNLAAGFMKTDGSAVEGLVKTGDLCSLIPNLEKVAGSTDASVRKSDGVKQAAINATTESASTVTQNSYQTEVWESRSGAGTFTQADKSLAIFISMIDSTGNVVLTKVLPTSVTELGCNSAPEGVSFIHRPKSGGVSPNYDPDIKSVGVGRPTPSSARKHAANKKSSNAASQQVPESAARPTQPVIVDRSLPLQETRGAGSFTISEEGLTFLKLKEGFAAAAYHDIKQYSIGYGSSKWKGQDVTPSYPGIITEPEAAEELRNLVDSVYGAAIQRHVTAPITQSMYDAMVSFAYNIGVGSPRRATSNADSGNGFAGSTVVANINAEDYEGSANAFAFWNKAGGKVNTGLVARRAEEAELFLSDGTPT